MTIRDSEATAGNNNGSQNIMASTLVVYHSVHTHRQEKENKKERRRKTESRRLGYTDQQMLSVMVFADVVWRLRAGLSKRRTKYGGR